MTVWTVPATVVRVHDGDTFTADLDLGWHVTLHAQNVRLEGVDAPELSAPQGPEARDFVVKALGAPPWKVTVVSSQLDRWGRVLGSVTLANGSNLALALVEAGLAKVWSGHGPRPWPAEAK